MICALALSMTHVSVLGVSRAMCITHLFHTQCILPVIASSADCCKRRTLRNISLPTSPCPFHTCPVCPGQPLIKALQMAEKVCLRLGNSGMLQTQLMIKDESRITTFVEFLICGMLPCLLAYVCLVASPCLCVRISVCI